MCSACSARNYEQMAFVGFPHIRLPKAQGARAKLAAAPDCSHKSIAAIAPNMFYRTLRPLLFSLDAERSHDLTLSLLSAPGSSAIIKTLLPAPVQDPVELMGLRFVNRIGLAAGLDKDARCCRAMQGLGFGFIEVGTVTPRPQQGNPKPRLFRLTSQESIINRMGFNNQGVEALVARLRQLKQQPLGIPLGVNIGKNKDTAQDCAADDYIACITAVADYADYITVNLSSPNTPGLRDLQFGEPLKQLMNALMLAKVEAEQRHAKRLPVLVKLAPDMADDDLKQVADTLIEQGVDGMILTNTTVDHSAVASSPLANEQGGLSGRVLFDKSTQALSTLAQHIQKEVVLIGVGGVNHPAHAVAKIAAGADLVQLYSGLIYQGPSLVRASARAIAANAAHR